MAASKSVGSLFIDIEARTAKLETDLAKTRGILTKLKSDVSVVSKGFSQAFGLMKGAIAAFASIQSLRALNNMSLAQYENVRSMIQLSDATGMTVSQIQVYNKAAETFNVTNVDMLKVMQQLYSKQADVRNGLRGSAAEFNKLGLSAEFVRNAMPADLFEATIEGLSKLGDSSTRAAMAQKMFGKQAQEMTPMIRQGAQALRDARDSINETGSALSRLDVAKVKVALGAINNLQDKWEAFKMRISIALAPVFYNLSNFLSNLMQSVDVEALTNKIVKFLLATYAFIVTFPERVKLVFLELRKAWNDLVASMGFGGDSMLGKIFGSGDEAKQKAAALQVEIDNLKASIASVGTEVESDFDEQVAHVMKSIGEVTVHVNKGISEASMMMIQTFTSAFSQLSDAIATFVVDGENQFADFGRMILKQMISTFIKVSLINPLLNAMFGGWVSGWQTLPSVTGLATGGPAVAGDVRMVGEKGPELVQFGSSAQVIPNDRTINRSGGGGGGMTINVHQSFMSGLTKEEFAASMPSIIKQTKMAVADGVMRGGGYRRAINT